MEISENFAFLKQEFPHAAESASYAERHVYGDPRASCFHALVQSFPEFLRAAPQEAVEAMNAALEWHVAHKHSPPDEEAAGFDLDGERALLRTDYSHIWDRGRGHPGEHAVELLDHVRDRLEALADGMESQAELANLLDGLGEGARELDPRSDMSAGGCLATASQSGSSLSRPDRHEDPGGRVVAPRLHVS